MKTIILAVVLVLRIVFAQECLIDGQSMYSIGSSEIVNGELLSLFRCNDGHQMWLSNYDEENIANDVVTKLNDEPQPDPTVGSFAISLLSNEKEQESGYHNTTINHNS